jgi:Zn-dependent protease
VESALIICLGWLLSVCLHEFGHAVVAYAGGDSSVKDKGYLTFNIFKYTDPQVTLVLPIIILILGGIALPGAAVYIDNRRLRNRAWRSAVSLAGPLASALSGVLFAAPFWLPAAPALPLNVAAALAFLVLLQIVAVLLNCLPVPGFDGYGIIEPWLPDAVNMRFRELGRYSFWLLLAAIWWIPGANDLLWLTAYSIAAQLAVPPELVAAGSRAFRVNTPLLVGALLLLLVVVHLRNRRTQPAG